ncbi:MAG: type II secretion system minor pseudopilin GspK [Brevundimonas sp.]
MSKILSRKDREGMALLVVLIMVAVLAVIAVAVLDDVRFSIRRAVNVETGAQAQWYAIGAERVALRAVRRLHEAGPIRTPLDPEWNGKAFSYPIEQGEIRAQVRDGQACFNLNSVVEGGTDAWVARPEGIAQFMALARALGLPEARARKVADSLTDWIDSDDLPRGLGAEDAVYQSRPKPYRTAGGLMVEASELRAVDGVDAATYRTLRPFLCALPEALLSPINVNTLTVEKAPLLVMLSDGRLSASAARSAIAAMPRGGWADAAAFWGQGVLRDAQPSAAVREQVGVRTRYFAFEAEVRYAGALAVRSGMIQISKDNRVQTVLVRWTAED